MAYKVTLDFDIDADSDEECKLLLCIYLMGLLCEQDTISDKKVQGIFNIKEI